ncbi:hypothetical protein [Leptospira borgpetersenii]|uniref:Uncharacterized protein n=1 Tax=Leptospira borgpetersenii serovar Hardjo-bovis (strain JB197) TaxID=355277 RepID=Q04P03_LEPBJ|nr:hypothetical protein [Leptospira borgpetersenii]ABJ77367.1 Hypothetical protein LBJ_2974 [Leptospira borgpetersenii serovar Hardjo-bovis str. JB197]ABJ77715.1 Hypothetical protein LBL_0091 [Leptospira borgpetersenii serovar Hardjo-bovis str. L550]AMX56928.1 hypothetical protein LBK6_00490 [Leptospira borgpetersenii serovar Hardjo]AMX60159.1 hypothetical protein LBK9_00490 [Leptospira borgpetersenii serovar Hardjo]AMX63406.1 hypothetical protein LBK30_00495 [Leptospira borgpetersenii serovar
MSQITDFFLDLKTSFNSLSQSIQSFLDTIGLITSFLKILFSIVPLDLFLVLIFSLILVLLLNTISPTTSRLNYTLSVLVVSTLRVFFHKSISQTWNLGPVFLTAIYLLIPAYSVLLFRFVFFSLKRFYKKKRELSPKDFENGLMNIQESFHNLMAKGYEELHSTDKKLYLDGNVLKEQVRDLERTIQGLKNFLDSKKE